MGITRVLLLLPAGLAYFPAELEKNAKIGLGHKYTPNVKSSLGPKRQSLTQQFIELTQLDLLEYIQYVLPATPGQFYIISPIRAMVLKH